MQSGEISGSQGMSEFRSLQETLGGNSFSQKPGENATNQMHLLVQEVSQKHDGEIEKEVEEQVTIEKRTSHDLQVRNTSQNDENYVVSEDRNYDEDYNWLKRKCDSLWAAFIINGKKNQRLKEEVEALEAERAVAKTAQRERDFAIRERDNIRGEFLNIKAERDVGKGELITARVERNTALRELATVKGERDGAKGELIRVRTEHDMAKVEIFKLRAELDAAKSKVTAVKEEYDAARAEVIALKKERDVVKVELIRSKAELDVTRRELANVTAERDGAKGELVVVKTEWDNAKVEVAIGRREMVALRRQFENLRASRDRLQPLVAGLGNGDLNAAILHDDQWVTFSSQTFHSKLRD